MDSPELGLFPSQQRRGSELGGSEAGCCRRVAGADESLCFSSAWPQDYMQNIHGKEIDLLRTTVKVPGKRLPRATPATAPGTSPRANGLALERSNTQLGAGAGEVAAGAGVWRRGPVWPPSPGGVERATMGPGKVGIMGLQIGVPPSVLLRARLSQMRSPKAGPRGISRGSSQGTALQWFGGQNRNKIASCRQVASASGAKAGDGGDRTSGARATSQPGLPRGQGGRRQGTALPEMSLVTVLWSAVKVRGLCSGETELREKLAAEPTATRPASGETWSLRG